MLLGTSLAITGYAKESRRHHEHALRHAREQDDNEMKIWIFWNMCRAAYITQDISNSPVRDFRGESAKIMELAGDLTSVYTQLLGTLGLAISCFIGESYAECEELLRGLLVRADETGTALEVGGLVRSVLADSFLAHGDIENALRYAKEGVEVSRKMDAQDQYAHALAVLVDALVRTKADAATVAPLIADARRHVEKSGGRMALPRLREAEARIDGRNNRATLLTGLREAQAMWRAMGAQDPVDRLAKELESAAR